eukprot:6172704-Pleurochrysis_carterae.AAC.1
MKTAACARCDWAALADIACGGNNNGAAFGGRNVAVMKAGAPPLPQPRTRACTPLVPANGAAHREEWGSRGRVKEQGEYGNRESE